MECKLCGKTTNEIEILNGIFENKIETICSKCAYLENIPLIRKLNFEEKKENLSVRDIMERMADHKKSISKDIPIVHRNLTKINFPAKREEHQDMIENYDWILKMARRRKKLSQMQLAEELIIPLKVITDLESGKIARDFMSYVEKIESYLGIRIRKKIPETFDFRKKQKDLEKEKTTVEYTKNNLLGKQSIKETERKNELDFSDRKELKEWTLSDVINLKRKKETIKEVKSMNK